jgi:hypothetical protein
MLQNVKKQKTFRVNLFGTQDTSFHKIFLGNLHQNQIKKKYIYIYKIK